jgi:hypothetical protein
MMASVSRHRQTIKFQELTTLSSMMVIIVSSM